MRLLTVATLALGAVALQPVQAATFNLTLDAADGSRWYTYRSDAYAELGSNWGVITNPISDHYGEQADGSWSISTPGLKFGSGWVTFADGPWDLGAINYDEATGAVTSLNLNFAPFIAPPVEISSDPYTTTLSNVSGKLSLVGGQVTGIDLDSTIAFTFGTFLGPARYTGSFSIDGNAFQLKVDDTVNAPGAGAFRYVWDVSGTVANVTAVPEPSTYALMAGGLLVVGAWSRRRAARA